jgi:murein endopeptidase
MAYTDAISNATKQLGLGADIWFEKDVTKYTKDSQEEQSAQPKQVAPAHTPQTLDELGKTLKTALEEVAKSKNVTELQSVWNKYTLLQKNESFKKEVTSKKKSL